MSDKVNLFDFDREALTAWFAEQGEKPFRARQLMKWIYHERVTNFDAMTDLSKPLREKLKATAELRFPTVIADRIASDGTRKWVFRYDCGNSIETVFIPEDDRGTLCISSQAGCALACPFCSTAHEGFNRNLTSGEIIVQVWLAKEMLNCDRHGNNRVVTNVVLMGMGEPLANWRQVATALHRIVDPVPAGFGLSARNVTVSTVGMVPLIHKLADEGLPVTLAVSLHAPDDALRDPLIPVNSRFKVSQLLDAARSYFDRTGRRVSIEYALIRDMNDHPWRAQLLADELNRRGRGWAHVNPIPLNPTPGSIWTASTPEAQNTFVRTLLDAGVPTTIRDTRGSDIDGACGQLRRRYRDKREQGNSKEE